MTVDHHRLTSEVTIDPRLGRHVYHDSRSYAYALPVLPKAAIKSVSWTRRVPIFDQGNLGSCTGQAAVGVLATDSSARTGRTTAQGAPVDQVLAVKVYSLGTSLDEFPGAYPPTDTGSSGVGVSKALQKMGLASRYNHAFSVDALKAALQTGPVMWGTVWLRSMYELRSDGTLSVVKTSGVAGGHELVISGYDVASDVYQGENSWGSSWGRTGTFAVTGADMAYLLSRSGDITQPVWTPETPVINDDTMWTAYQKLRAAEDSYQGVMKDWAAYSGLT